MDRSVMIARWEECYRVGLLQDLLVDLTGDRRHIGLFHETLGLSILFGNLQSFANLVQHLQNLGKLLLGQQVDLQLICRSR